MSLLTGDARADVLAVFVALVAVVIGYFKWSFTYWKRKGVVAPPTTLPYGNASSVFRRQATLGVNLKNVYDEYKNKGLRYCGYYFLSKPNLLLWDPDLIRSILNKDFQHFTDHANYVNEKIDPLSGHLFSLKGRKWKNLRAKLTPTFTSGKMKMMFQTLVDCSDGLVVLMDKAAAENSAVDIKDLVGRFTTDVIGSCAFGINCNSLQDPDSEFRRYGKKVFELRPAQAIKNLLTISLPFLLDIFKIPITPPDVTDFFMKAVNETVTYREKNNIARKDFMHLLIQLKNNVKIQDGDSVGAINNVNKTNGAADNSEVGKSLTMEELAAQAFVFFIAGFETSSTTLTFCFYELAANHDLQTKLREEINHVLTKHDEKITYGALMDMTYMDKCINETLRKYPPISFLHRECTKPYKIPNSDLVLEQGTAIFLPILGIQRDPEYYPDPEKFDPERFSPENEAKRHAFTWLPFGEGPRACIGIRFGLMETKVALAVLLKNYIFSLHSKTKVPLVLDPKRFVLSAEGGVWLTAKKIKQ